VAKSLCKWKKAEYKSDHKKLVKIVSKPKYVCQGCGRAARSRKALCNPAELG
jgi:hypothetical protein